MPPQLLEGWLWKQGAIGFVKGWKNRWFAMPNEFEIHYYASNTSLESLGYIDTRIITSVAADTTKKKESKGYLFYITTPARVYNLAANSEKELNYWVDGISNMLPDRKKTASMELSQIQADTEDKNKKKAEEEKLKHDQAYGLELLAQLLQEKDTKFEVLSKEAGKQRLKLEACERELASREEKMNALLDQVQNLTSLVAHEKSSNESSTEEAALQHTRLQQLADHLEKEIAKRAELEKTVAELQEQKASALQLGNTVNETEGQVQELMKKISELEFALAKAQEEAKEKEATAQAQQTAMKELEVKWEEIQRYLKEKADQVEEWKQRWTIIEESLNERVRDDEEQRTKLQLLQREHEERLSELEHFKSKWWEGKEKVDEAQRVAREREEEAEKWRLRWEELNVELKAQEESIADVGKEWDEIHLKLNNELEEWKASAKQREAALNAVSVFLDQLCALASEPTENGASPKKEDGKEAKSEDEGLRTSGGINAMGSSGEVNSSGGITSSGGVNSSGGINASGGINSSGSHKNPATRKLSLPARALQGKYEPLSQRGIAIFHMLEEKRQLEYENRDLKRELEDWKQKGQAQPDVNQAQASESSKDKEDIWQREIAELRQSEAKYKDELHSLRTELEEIMKSEFALRQALRQSEEDSRDTSRKLREEIEQLKSELQAERVSEAEGGVGADAVQKLLDAHEEAKSVRAKIDEAIRETKANDATAQVLKDAEEAVKILHAKISHMAQDMESMRTTHAEELAALREKLLETKPHPEEKGDALESLQRRVEELTRERDALAHAITNTNSEDLRKKVEELENELRAKEDDFRILRQVRQGEMLIKEEELRKKEAELQELRAQHDPHGIAIPGAREIALKPQLLSQNSMPSLEILQRSPLSSRVGHDNLPAMKAKIEELIADLKSKKEELRQKDATIEAHELETQELRMRMTEMEMEAKQREAELTAEKEMKVVEMEHEMQMRVAEFEQAIRTRDFELQMRDAELRAVTNQVAVVHTKNEIMRAEADELVVTRVQEETSQKEEEVQDLYGRLAMAEQVVVGAHNEIAQREASLQELHKRAELLEGWLREKEAELQHLHNEKQKNKRLSGQEIETLTLQVQEKTAQIEALQKRVATLQDTISINSREVVEQKMSAEVVELQKKVARLNNELASKDEIISNRLREFDKKAAGKEGGLMKQLENEREARMAQQQHIIFLCQELDKRELEVKTKDAKLQALLERSAMMEMTSEEATAEVKRLNLQLHDLMESYFLSVGRSIKLQGSLVGWFVNISLNELYEEAMEASVPLEQWPSWITKKFQDQNQKSAPIATSSPMKSSGSAASSPIRSSSSATSSPMRSSNVATPSPLKLSSSATSSPKKS